MPGAVQGTTRAVGAALSTLPPRAHLAVPDFLSEQAKVERDRKQGCILSEVAVLLLPCIAPTQETRIVRQANSARVTR